MRERICKECGEIFDAIDDQDWLCKRCLLQSLADAQQFLIDEIEFYKEIDPPLKERIYCQIFRLTPRHETIQNELEWVLWHLKGREKQ